WRQRFRTLSFALASPKGGASHYQVNTLIINLSLKKLSRIAAVSHTMLGTKLFIQLCLRHILRTCY
ncbi:MAG: hypothetical protein OXH48_09680, partial [Chloroflexi bacterium]|nr:hypothetical protein [Chloroflexota bacterium]